MRFRPLKRKLRVERRFSRMAIFQRRSGLSVEAGSWAWVQFLARAAGMPPATAGKMPAATVAAAILGCRITRLPAG